ncbi:hypothetical protein ADICYQ_2782 [Cyclobacterium qasimii M12-11B]|uniref:Uncharacterized protein n=1 Tax=Cyclobacterium qasimii M12-11B TaxID=641524 RepID=S7VFJ8_9BACT|nr:hypothetical protein ADICYQ_2782 [Cyclobacterium qasimii M12-11B]
MLIKFNNKFDGPGNFILKWGGMETAMVNLYFHGELQSQISVLLFLN